MRNDKLYQKLVLKMHQVALVPPQTVGPLTPVYKKFVPQLKFFPFKLIVPVSMLFILMAYLVFGTLLVRLAEILQGSF